MRAHPDLTHLAIGHEVALGFSNGLLRWCELKVSLWMDENEGKRERKKREERKERRK